MDEQLVAVLHALRVKGAGTVEDLERISGVADAAAALRGLEADGLAATTGAYATATEAGLARDAELAATRLVRDREALATVYDERFLPVNADFKALATQLQDRGPQPELIERAADVHDLVAAIVADAAAEAPHLARYRDRLEESMDRFLSGDAAALTGAVGPSYHNTWFELHEDFIATLGRSREKETA
jgi:hypothetical protein